MEHSEIRERGPSGSSSSSLQTCSLSIADDPVSLQEEIQNHNPLAQDISKSIDDQSKIESKKDYKSAIIIKLKYWWWTQGIEQFIIVLYICLNLGLAIHKFYDLYNYSELTDYLGLSFCFARASALIINLNSALLLLPVLRNVLSWLRGTWVNNYIPIDRSISLHKMCGLGLLVGTIIHVISHYINLEKVLRSPIEEIDYYLNVSKEKQHFTKLYLFYGSVYGLTGHLMVLILLLMMTSSIEKIKRPMFEIFYYTHHLFIPYFVLLCFHGYAKLLKSDPQSWMWVIAPMLFYAIERIFRIYRGNKEVLLAVAKQHPSKVLELRFKRDNFTFLAGQYLYLNCPFIAQHEWHPFTITSAPEESFVSVHINIVGNWTGKLYKFLNPNEKLGIIHRDLLKDPNGDPIFRIDGPFGAASQDVFKYKTAILIGAGIGVTPFSSILKHIKIQIQQNLDKPPINKIYFLWISREKNSFQWFSTILGKLEQDNPNDFLQMQTFLTGELELEDWNKIVEGMSTIDTNEHSDFITGLKSFTMFGRPNFERIFTEISDQHPNEKIGLFFCGPKTFGKEIQSFCKKFNGYNNCRYQFYKENF
ncbi:hypothetical protein CYY_003242 [Polysphondylium violaceum]|uniref:FAD-binding FR-type domain-containing protein n=1 Tax=Polysphondylium violaceum TaxID=133409 RepID=A0A8J4Q726_9MYCE|nr:hypothetical protein CYY_003242 [Polysphondylium violaceum]